MRQRRMHRKGCAVLLAAAIFAPPVAAGTLPDALVEAVTASPDLLAARADARVLTERAVQARSRGRIQIEGAVSVEAESTRYDPVLYPTTFELSATQPLYTGGQVANATEAALTRLSAQQVRIEGIEQVVLLDAVTAYLDVLRDEALIGIAGDTVNNIGEQLDAARARFEVGENTNTDVAQAEARLAASQSLLAARQGALEASREFFRRAVGSYPRNLQPPPPLPDLPDSLEHAVTIAMAEDPSIAAARLERLAAGSDVRAAIGALLPQIALLGRLTRSDVVRTPADDRTDLIFGLQLSLPFYAGGENHSRVREAQAVVEQRAADVTAAMRDTLERVGTAWANLEVARASIEAGVVEVAAQQLAVEGVRQELMVGARSTLDVLNAEQELLDARADLVSARRDEYVSAFQLLFSIGKLNVGHLGLDLQGDRLLADYVEGTLERDFGFDPSDDTLWTTSYRP